MARRFAFIVLAACGGSQHAPPAAPPPPHSPVVAPTQSDDGNPPPPAPVADQPTSSDAIRCEDIATSDYSIDGLLDDWRSAPVAARIGAAPDGSFALRCAWDGTHVALSIDVTDDRLVRVASGRAHEDHVSVALAAGGRPLRVDVFPGNAMARPRVVGTGAEVADSLQPHGFSIELRAPAAAIPGFSGSTPAIALDVTFHDSDRATGGDDADIALATKIELAERKDLVDDFLHTVHLARSDITMDQLADLDPDRKGKERIVAGGNAIGIITDQFAYVTMPEKPVKIELVPLGRQQIIAATLHETGNGGSRDILMLWTVWSGQLQPLKTIELRKEIAGNVLACSWKVEKGKLVVRAQPAVGFTAETWNEEPAQDADSILLPWQTASAIYTLKGAELERREVPAKKR